MRFTAGSVLPRQEKISLPAFLATGKMVRIVKLLRDANWKGQGCFRAIFVQGDFFVNN